MTRAATAHNPGVSLFPFLAVLICTMGVMMLLLVIINRPGSGASMDDADASVEPPPGAVQATPEMIQQAREMLAWKISQLHSSREQTESDLSDRQLRLSAIEEHLRKLQGEWRGMNRAVGDLEQADKNKGTERQTAAAKIEELKTQVAAAGAEVKQAAERKSKEPPSFAIIPYDGPNGTRRRPIYIECRPNGVVLEPEGISFFAKDFQGPEGPGNPLASTLRAARDYIAAQNAAMGLQGEPYPLLIVRPDGIAAFAVARAAMSSWKSDFGYELVEQDQKVAYPAVDARLADVEQAALADARARYAYFAQTRTGKKRVAAARPQYRAAANGGGIVQEDASLQPDVTDESEDPFLAAVDGEEGSSSGPGGGTSGNGGAARGSGPGGAPIGAGPSGVAGGTGPGIPGLAGIPGGGSQGIGYVSGSLTGGSGNGAGTGGQYAAQNGQYGGSGPRSGTSDLPGGVVGGSAAGGNAVGPGGMIAAGGGTMLGGVGTDAGSGVGSGSGLASGSVGPGFGTGPGGVANGTSGGQAYGNAPGGAATADLTSSGDSATASGNHTATPARFASASHGPADISNGFSAERSTPGVTPTGVRSTTGGTGTYGATSVYGGDGTTASGSSYASSPNGMASPAGAGDTPGAPGGYNGSALAPDGQSHGGGAGDSSGPAGVSASFNMTPTPGGGGGMGSSDIGPPHEPGLGEYIERPSTPPPDPKKDKKDDDDKKTHSLADKRGRNWSLPSNARKATAVSRPIHIECRGDAMIIQPDPGNPQPQVIPFKGRTEDSVDQLVSAIWTHTKGWGLAGKQMYWHPMLILEMGPSGEGRFGELQTLMADSGLEIRRK